jgi:hypothetical protein
MVNLQDRCGGSVPAHRPTRGTPTAARRRRLHEPQLTGSRAGRDIVQQDICAITAGCTFQTFPAAATEGLDGDRDGAVRTRRTRGLGDDRGSTIAGPSAGAPR